VASYVPAIELKAEAQDKCFSWLDADMHFDQDRVITRYLASSEITRYLASSDVPGDPYNQRVPMFKVFRENEADSPSKYRQFEIPFLNYRLPAAFDLLDNGFFVTFQDDRVFLCHLGLDKVHVRGSYQLPRGSFGAQVIHHDQRAGELLIYRSHVARVWKLAYTRGTDEEKKLSADSDATSSLVLKQEFHPLRHLLCAIDGEHVAVLTTDGSIDIIKLSDGQLVKRLKGHGANIKVNNLLIAPKGRLVSSGAKDKMIKVWKIKTGACLHTIHTPYQFVCGKLAVSAELLVSVAPRYQGPYESLVDVWSLDRGHLIMSIPPNTTSLLKHVRSAHFSPSGMLYLCGEKGHGDGGRGQVMQQWDT